MANLTIFLPENATVAVEKGASVSAGMSLVKATKANHVYYDLVSLFSIKPQALAGILTKKEGDEFVRGEILARKRGILKTRSLRAPFHGKIGRIDRELGEMEIIPADVEDTQPITAPVSGKIEKITKTEITLAFDGILIFAKQGVGRLRKGTLTFLKEADGEVLVADIKQEHAQKILLGGHFSRVELEKAFGIGVAAVLATKLDEGDFAFFSEKKVFDASLLLVAKIDFAALKKYSGKEAVVEGAHKRVLIET